MTRGARGSLFGGDRNTIQCELGKAQVAQSAILAAVSGTAAAIGQGSSNAMCPAQSPMGGPAMEGMEAAAVNFVMKPTSQLASEVYDVADHRDGVIRLPVEVIVSPASQGICAKMVGSLESAQPLALAETAGEEEEVQVVDPPQSAPTRIVPDTDRMKVRLAYNSVKSTAPAVREVRKQPAAKPKAPLGGSTFSMTLDVNSAVPGQYVQQQSPPPPPQARPVAAAPGMPTVSASAVITSGPAQQQGNWVFVPETPLATAPSTPPPSPHPQEYQQMPFVWGSAPRVAPVQLVRTPPSYCDFGGNGGGNGALAGMVIKRYSKKTCYKASDRGGRTKHYRPSSSSSARTATIPRTTGFTGLSSTALHDALMDFNSGSRYVERTWSATSGGKTRSSSGTRYSSGGSTSYTGTKSSSATTSSTSTS